jgi:hypothetical protein
MMHSCIIIKVKLQVNKLSQVVEGVGGHVLESGTLDFSAKEATYDMGVLVTTYGNTYSSFSLVSPFRRFGDMAGR